MLHPALQLLVSNLQSDTDSDNFADIAAGELQEQKGTVDPGRTYLLDMHGLATLEFCNLLVEFLVAFPARYHDDAVA